MYNYIHCTINNQAIILLKKISSGKHSSLVGPSTSDEVKKKFYDIDTCTRDKKIDKHSSLLAKRSIMHRYKTRVQKPAKMFPHLKLLCWLFMGPTPGIDT